MDIICDVLKQYYMLDEKEEKNMKKKIKDCLKNNKANMVRILYYEIDLSELYANMNVAHFGHILAFYSLIETYEEIIDNKTKQEKKILIVQLTLQSLDDFERYKGKQLQEIYNIFFYPAVRDLIIKNVTQGLLHSFFHLLFN